MNAVSEAYNFWERVKWRDKKRGMVQAAKLR